MDFTVIGDVVSRPARYGTAETKGEVLISAEVREWLSRILQIEPMAIKTKQDGNFLAYRVEVSKTVAYEKKPKLEMEMGKR
jgi:class 3 adenylate cyclase